MYWFLIPLIIGFALTWASAFTAAYSRRWGERGGKVATSVLRNFVGIPLWYIGLVLAWLQPAPPLFVAGVVTTALSWLLIVAGFVPVTWGHLALGWRTHFPSIKDTLVRDGLYGHVRHPIYAGGFLIFVGLGLLNPTSTVLLACGLGLVWLIIQARLEEDDLLQRMPAYKNYMAEVPRFFPRLWTKNRFQLTREEVSKMAKDPVCGMDIDEKTAAATAVYKGKTYYFCAPGCRAQFEKAPDHYVQSH